jgi:hypothetical protein
MSSEVLITYIADLFAAVAVKFVGGVASSIYKVAILLFKLM